MLSPVLLALALLTPPIAPAPSKDDLPEHPRIAVAEGLVAPDVVPVPVATGLQFTEGPAADESGLLHFTDLARSRIHVLPTRDPLRATKEGPKATEFLVNSRGMNGLVFTKDGRLLGCQGNAGALVEIDRATKAIRPLTESVTIDGAEVRLGRINDLAVDGDGGVYFTDPSLGRGESPSRGVLYRAPDGTTKRLDTTVGAPNGAALSPDGKRLYVLSYRDPGIYAFEVLAPGSLAPPVRIGDLRSADGVGPLGRGDGLAIDRDGRLWCTNPETKQVQIFSPEGHYLGRITFPEGPANCAFGGSDARTLYVTAGTTVYAVPTLVEGYWIARSASPPNPQP